MSPAARAFAAHAVAYPLALIAAWGVLRSLGGLVARGAPEGAVGTGMLLLGAAAMAVGAVIWLALLGRMLKFRPALLWWVLAVGAAVGIAALGLLLAALGVFAFIEALTLVLFLLFALGGWASSKRVAA